LCDLKISCNLEIGTQFLDSENAQRNLDIVQIPRLRGMSELTNGRNLEPSEMVKPLMCVCVGGWGGGHSTGLGCLCARNQIDWREFSELVNFPGVGGFDMPGVDGGNRAIRATYVHSLPLYTMENRTTTWVLNTNCVISRLCAGATQSRDCVSYP